MHPPPPPPPLPSPLPPLSPSIVATSAAAPTPPRTLPSLPPISSLSPSSLSPTRLLIPICLLRPPHTPSPPKPTTRPPYPSATDQRPLAVLVGATGREPWRHRWRPGEDGQPSPLRPPSCCFARATNARPAVSPITSHTCLRSERTSRNRPAARSEASDARTVGRRAPSRAGAQAGRERSQGAAGRWRRARPRSRSGGCVNPLPHWLNHSQPTPAVRMTSEVKAIGKLA